MIPPDLKVIDLGARNYPRLAELLVELASLNSQKERKGALLLVYRGLKLLYAADLLTGTRIPVYFKGTYRLEEITAQTGYERVIALQEDALSRVLGDAQRNINPQDDFVSQLYDILKAFRKELGKSVHLFPLRLSKFPLISPSILRLAISVLIPDNSLVSVFITEGGSVWASLVLGFNRGELWLITTHEAVMREELEPGLEDLEIIAEGLEERFGGVARCVFVERKALLKLAERRFSPAQILLAYNRGEIGIFRFPLRWKVMVFLAAISGCVRTRSQGSGRRQKKGHGARERSLTRES